MEKQFNAGKGFNYGDLGLNNKQKTDLKKLLVKSGMTDAQKSEFLDKVSTEIDKLNKGKLFKDKAIKASNDLKEFSQAAHSLKVAIEKLNQDNQEAFRIYAMFFDECTHAEKPAIVLSDEMRNVRPPLGSALEATHKLLGEFEKVLPDLEKVADYTIKELEDNLSNGKRLSDINGIDLAVKINKVHRDLLHTLPPHSRNCWFDEFMSSLAETLDPEITMGARTLEKAHKQLAQGTIYTQ